jgi:ribA/ribD-fused uncharacterized protein
MATDLLIEAIGIPTDLTRPSDIIGAFRGEASFLSNFHSEYPSLVIVDWDFNDISYPTVEHAYQAAKQSDRKWKSLIQHAATPAKAKFLGRTAVLRPKWDTLRLEVMQRLIFQKFNRGTNLPVSHLSMAQKLLDTGRCQLVEGNTWHDCFWGKCSCPKCHGKLAENHLGRLLMKRRAELASQLE